METQEILQTIKSDFTNDALIKALNYWKNEGSVGSNQNLRVLLKHFTALEAALKLHGVVYQLVWLDTFRKLSDLQSYYRHRNQKEKLDFDITGEFIK